MARVLLCIQDVILGVPATVLILGIGLFLTIRLGAPQVVLLPKALRLFFRRLFSSEAPEEGVSPFQALCTALAATVGTGNLVAGRDRRL